MNKITISLIVLTIFAASGVGYWMGAQRVPPAPSTSLAAAKPAPKILYYRNPMGLPDTSPTPKQDEMGMDYIPVYEGEIESGGAIQLSVAKVQKLGVKTELATLRTLDNTLHVTGRVEVDERRIVTIAPKFGGWVERLLVNTTGQTVAVGQALFEVYSPELVSTQHEYTLAKQGITALQQADSEAQNGMKQLAAASLARLKNWGVTTDDSNARSITFRSPVAGIVMDKKTVQGMRFSAGDILYQIADLSSVWVIAEVAEQDVAHIQLGSPAEVSFTAYPNEFFAGKVNYIYPILNPTTRTVQIRIELANPKGKLKPALFAHVALQNTAPSKVLTVPNAAIIDSGTRQVVLVQLAQGRFEPRTVKLGQRGNDYVEVKEGIGENEQIVTAANFLIDAESNLRAALSGMSTASAPAGH